LTNANADAVVADQFVAEAEDARAHGLLMDGESVAQCARDSTTTVAAASFSASFTVLLVSIYANWIR
jgi:hypothetical protein